MSGTLYLVGTPIGNLGDISVRAAQTLRDVDFIAAEDTRVSRKLLEHLDIKKPLISYHEHNRIGSGEKILERLLSGENCALISDAGMPAISDPGEDLVRICAEAGVVCTVIPGPCAAVSALCLSGLPSGRFTFEGFLSTSRKSRNEHLDELKTERRTMIFYEAPHKLCRTLHDMLAAFGDRPVSISREITKLFEETKRTTLSAAADFYDENPPRGEFVLVIEGLKPEPPTTVTIEDAATVALGYNDDGMSLMDAVKKAASETGIPKNALYDAACKIKKMSPSV